MSESVAISASSSPIKVSAAFTGADIFVQQLSAHGEEDFTGLSFEQQEATCLACPPVNEAIAQ